MLPFELSAIDLILVIAVIVLLILYVTKSSTEPPTEEKRFAEEKIPPKKPAVEATDLKIEGERKLLPHARKDSLKCPYGFGYLKKLDKAAPIPDECLGCSRIMECSSASE